MMLDLRTSISLPIKFHYDMNDSNLKQARNSSISSSFDGPPIIHAASRQEIWSVVMNLNCQVSATAAKKL